MVNAAVLSLHCVCVCVCVCAGAVKKLVHKVAGERGFSVQELTLHFPLNSASQVRECVCVCVCLSDHIGLSPPPPLPPSLQVIDVLEATLRLILSYIPSLSLSLSSYPHPSLALRQTTQLCQDGDNGPHLQQPCHHLPRQSRHT